MFQLFGVGNVFIISGLKSYHDSPLSSSLFLKKWAYEAGLMSNKDSLLDRSKKEVARPLHDDYSFKAFLTDATNSSKSAWFG